MKKLKNYLVETFGTLLFTVAVILVVFVLGSGEIFKILGAAFLILLTVVLITIVVCYIVVGIKKLRS